MVAGARLRLWKRPLAFESLLSYWNVTGTLYS